MQSYYEKEEDVWNKIPAVVSRITFLMYGWWSKFSSSWQHWRCFVVADGYGSGHGAASATINDDDGVVHSDGGGIFFGWMIK